jgi:hypothetical protein
MTRKRCRGCNARVTGKARRKIREQGARHPRRSAPAGGDARDLQRGRRGLGAKGGSSVRRADTTSSASPLRFSASNQST